MRTSQGKIKTLEDFTPEEIERFDEMHRVLKGYNKKLGTDNEDPLPKYTNNEMAEYSGYRELLIARECED